jgi:hypothetical protein
MSSSHAPLPPSAAARRRVAGLRRLALWLGVLVPAMAIACALLVRHEPTFYSAVHEEIAAGADAAVVAAMRQRASARFVSKIAGLVADVSREGTWSTVIGDDELNAWLAVELPVNHPELLPMGVSDLRAQFVPGEVLVGCRVGGILGGLAWLEMRVQLLDANRIAVTVERCRVGLLPVPPGLVASQVAKSLRRAEVACEMLRREGQTQLVVQLPAAAAAGHGGAAVRWWLDGLRIEQGDVVLTGTSRRVQESRQRVGT